MSTSGRSSSWGVQGPLEVGTPTADTPTLSAGNPRITNEGKNDLESHLYDVCRIAATESDVITASFSKKDKSDVVHGIIADVGTDRSGNLCGGGSSDTENATGDKNGDNNTVKNTDDGNLCGDGISDTENASSGKNGDNNTAKNTDDGNLCGDGTSDTENATGDKNNDTNTAQNTDDIDGASIIQVACGSHNGGGIKHSSADHRTVNVKHGIDNASFLPDCESIKSIIPNANLNNTAANRAAEGSNEDNSRRSPKVYCYNVDVLDVLGGSDDVKNIGDVRNVSETLKSSVSSLSNVNSDVGNSVSTENIVKISGSGSAVSNSRSALRNQIVGAVAGSLMHFALGTIVGLSGIILPALVDPHSGDLVLDTHQATLFSSLMNIGALVGSISSGPLMVFWGQRVTLLAALPLAAAGWFLMAFTSSVWLLQAARVLLGFITGIYGGPSVNYVAEISHTSVRGRLTGMVDLFRQLGFLFVYVVGSSGLSWRQTSMVCGGVTTVIPFLALFFLPNSPRWLATRSRVTEARQSLKFYRGSVQVAEEELKDINQQLQIANKHLSTKGQLMVCRKPAVTKIIIVLILMFSMYQFSGNFSMIVFSVTIFQSAQSTISEYSSTIIIGVVRVFGVLAYISLADKIGRKTLLVSSSVLGSLAMCVMGLYFYLVALEVDTSQIQWLPLASMAVFIFFTCVAEPALILLRAELLPTSIRSVGVPIVYTFFFSGAFLVSYLYPMMVEHIGSHGTFWTYAADGLVMALVGALFIPETISKSLEDIERAYDKKKEGKRTMDFKQN